MSRSLIVLLLVGLVCPHVASAQPKEDARAAAAKAYFERGDAHFKGGRYLEARAEFSAGYELSRRPLFLFNMAECSRLNGDADIARETYERYLLAEPNGAQAGLARQRLAALAARPAGPPKEPPKAEPPRTEQPKTGVTVGPQPPKTEPPKTGPVAGGAQPPKTGPVAGGAQPPKTGPVTAAAPPPASAGAIGGPAGPPTSAMAAKNNGSISPCEGSRCWGARNDGRTKRYVGLALGGVGLAFGITGIYFWRHAASLGDDVTNACKNGCDWSAVKGTYESSQSAERKQWVFLGLGVSALAAGGVVYWLGERDRRASGLAVIPQPGGGAVTWSGSW